MILFATRQIPFRIYLIYTNLFLFLFFVFLYSFNKLVYILFSANKKKGKCAGFDITINTKQHKCEYVNMQWHEIEHGKLIQIKHELARYCLFSWKFTSMEYIMHCIQHGFFRICINLNTVILFVGGFLFSHRCYYFMLLLLIVFAYVFGIIEVIILYCILIFCTFVTLVANLLSISSNG